MRAACIVVALPDFFIDLPFGFLYGGMGNDLREQCSQSYRGEREMEGYVEAGLVVIQLAFMLATVASVWVMLTLMVAFVTDKLAQMPKLLRFIPFRDDDYLQRTHSNPAPISGFVLFQVMAAGYGLAFLSLFLWPLYIAIAFMYTIREAYRHRETIMKLLRAMMSYRPSKSTGAQADKWSGMDVIEKTHRELQIDCTCEGAPHDDDCAIIKAFVPRWAKAPAKAPPHVGSIIKEGD